MDKSSYIEKLLRDVHPGVEEVEVNLVYQARIMINIDGDKLAYRQMVAKEVADDAVFNLAQFFHQDVAEAINHADVPPSKRQASDPSPWKSI